MNALPLLVCTLLLGAEPTTINLWGEKIPGPVSSDPKNVPTLTIQLADKDKASGTAVVICPGGGYSGRATGHEGKQIAAWLNERGVHAFILKYRTVGESQIPAPLQPGPMLDVQRAIRTVRAQAKDYGVDPSRIGVWGFSAGGHLASTAATHFDEGQAAANDPIDKVSCRPDFAILAYPVITMGAKTHGGSKANLIGKQPDEKLVEFYSNEKQVTCENAADIPVPHGAGQGRADREQPHVQSGLRKSGSARGVGRVRGRPARRGTWPEHQLATRRVVGEAG